MTRFCNELTNKVEANPDRYHRFSFKPLLADSRERVAQLVGAHTDECVFVSNATAAINTIMRNLEWNAEDIIIQSPYPFPFAFLTQTHLPGQQRQPGVPPAV